MNDTDSPTSPPCYLADGELDAVGLYLGFIPADELIGNLQELLAAEIAGVNIAADCLRELGEEAGKNPTIFAILTDLEKNEATGCRLLSQCLEVLGAGPIHEKGPFYEKVMSISAIEARLELISREQNRVARRLQEIIPRCADSGIRARLKAVLNLHAVR